jgi:transposase
MLSDNVRDSNALREQIAGMGAEAVISASSRRKVLIPHDATDYKHRNWIERRFNRTKHFRRFATRFDRPTVRFARFVRLAAAMIWLG